MSHEADLVELFDRLAADGTAERAETLLDDVARQALDAMEVRPGHQLLDAGCGVGWATRRLGKKAPGAQAVGIDVSPEMIAKADGLSDWTSRARFERIPIETIDFPEGRFDHVLALDVLEYVEDPERALASLARVTGSGGKFELIVHRHVASPASEGWPDVLGVPMHWLDETQWTDLVESAGFRVEASETLRETRDAAPFEATPRVPDEAARDALLRDAGLLWIRSGR